MKRTLERSLASFYAVALTLGGASACGQPPSVEQQIIATIRSMEAKIEAGESRRFMQHVAAGFEGQQGAMTRQQVHALVLFQLKRYQRLRAQLLPISVAPESEVAARARFRALVSGGPEWIPESGQLYEFETRWVRENDEWLLQSARWRPVPLDEVL
ncbi:MAG: hypothetical protein RQ826_01625 [Xanthomonadales bacterium]|nr:hypothetical protein [Xanthomonadales bacterium]